VRNQTNIPDLTKKLILKWANGRHRRSGKWPTEDSGPIPEAPGETWAAIDAALRQGCRGLRGGSSLARLLAEHRGRKNIHGLPPLSQRKMLAWAEPHFQRTGEWPNRKSGDVFEAPHEKWHLIDEALRQGHRGMPGGSSLLKLLAKKRGLRNPLNLPPLTAHAMLLHSFLTIHRPDQPTPSSADTPPVPTLPGDTAPATHGNAGPAFAGLPAACP
jgi:hypothetical protein